MWPGMLGLTATFSPEVMKRFGEIVSEEYRALGLTTALFPQVDIGTDPRWFRYNYTLGEDPNLAVDLAKAYTEGLQTDTITEVENGWGYKASTLWSSTGPAPEPAAKVVATAIIISANTPYSPIIISQSTHVHSLREHYRSTGPRTAHRR